MLDSKERFKWQTDTLQAQFNLLFQRVNFFLVGTTFIITAFATVVASGKTELVLLSHFLCGTGYYLALFFTVTNYLNAKVIESWSRRLERREITSHYMPGMEETLNAVFREDIGGVRLLGLFIEDLIGVVRDPFGQNAHRPGPHTWILPLGFMVFWALVWGILPASSGWLWEPGWVRIGIWPQTFFIMLLPASAISILAIPRVGLRMLLFVILACLFILLVLPITSLAFERFVIVVLLVLGSVASVITLFLIGRAVWGILNSPHS